MKKLVAIVTSTVVVLAIDYLVIGQWAFVRASVNLSVCLLIVLTIIDGLVSGLIVAAIVGLVASVLSVTSGPAHLAAMLGVPLTVWFCSVKIFTTRSVISFITTIVVATIMYTAVLLAFDQAALVFDHGRLRLPWLATGLSVVIMCFTHPMVIGAWWRLSDRGAYGKVTEKIQVSF